MRIKSLAIFCGSKTGSNKKFSDDARQIGMLMAENNIALIYGGGSTGLMGAVASAVMEANGRVVGVMPSILVHREKQHDALTELHEVDDMHARKKMMYEKCDGVLILPGGFGTMDEMFEVLTWNQLKLHDKKIFLLNTDGFYNSLISQLNEMQKEGFIYDNASDTITIINSSQEFKDTLKEFS